MNNNHENLHKKINNEAILDSEIIQEMESLKRNDPKFDINLGDDYRNWSLLMYAVDNCREDFVRYLLSYPNINVNHRSNYDYTALHVCGQVSILKLFLDRRELDVNIQNDLGQTGLHRLCSLGRKALVKELLLDARVNTSIRDGWGETARDIALRNKDYNIAKIIGNSRHTTLLRIPNYLLLHDIVRMIIEEYTEWDEHEVLCDEHEVRIIKK